MQNITFKKSRNIIIESGSKIDYWDCLNNGEMLLGIHIERKTYKNGEVSKFTDGNTYWIGGYNAFSDKMMQCNDFSNTCKDLNDAREKINFIISTNSAN